MEGKRSSKGMTLLECAVSMAIMATLLLSAAPALDNMHRRYALATAADRVRRQMVRAQSTAAALSKNCGVYYFQTNGEWMYAIYTDENGNGVLRSEIASGVDRRIEGPFPLLNTTAPIEVGIGNGFTDPDTLAPFTAGTSPIEFNSSFICSFSQTGSGTPGTIFLTDGGSLGAAVRSSGSDGNLRKLYYAGKGQKWVER
jgi:prepilin-type N-terminal cleavage/methylation domain-containing protein